MTQSYLIFSEGRKMTVKKATKFGVSANSNRFNLDSGKFSRSIRSLVKQWEEGGFSELKLFTPEPEVAFDRIKAVYDQFITAAGGVVINRNGKLLMIFRKGKWDLPKGKVEKRENLRDAAIREVMEETGLRNLVIGTEIIRTYHTYTLYGKRVLKETVWFLMKCDDDDTRPQLSEGITAVKWISRGKVKTISKNTFENIILVLKAYFGNKT